MEDCKWAKKSCFEGRMDACLNPSVHMTRCDTRLCPYKNNEDVSSDSGSGSVSDQQASDMLEGFFLGAAMQCGDLFDQMDD